MTEIQNPKPVYTLEESKFQFWKNQNDQISKPHIQFSQVLVIGY